MSKRRLTMALIFVLVILAIAVLALFYKIGHEVVSELTVLNAEGDQGTALVVYHPGLSDFQQKVTYAFAEGLISNGWRVEITTASVQAPTDLSRYDLLVLGSPTYDWAPARPLQSYVSRLRDLGGKHTVLLITGMGATGRSMAIMQKLVQEARGNLVKSLSLFTIRPNNEAVSRPNREVALEMAMKAGKETPLPGE